MRTSIINPIRSCAAVLCFMAISIFAQAQTSTERNTGDFTGIKAGGAFEIILTQGNTSVKIEAEQKTMNKIKTEVKNGMLNIYTDGKTENNGHVKIYVSVKELRKIDISGAAKLQGESVFTSEKITLISSGAARIDIGIKASELAITASGASSVDVKGSVSMLEANISGASSLRAYDVAANTVSVEASGASSAKVNAGKEITAEASGASSINYKGEPGTKNINRSGSSSVRKDS